MDMKKIVMFLFLVVAFLLFGYGSVYAGSLPTKVGLCLPEPGTDKGWNEQARVGLEAVAEKYNFEMVLAEALGYQDIKPTLRDLVRKGCDLIILHASGYATSGSEIEKEYGVKMVLAESPNNMIVPGRISGIRSHAGPGGYLAGVLAARTSRTNIIGAVTSAETGTSCRAIAGYLQGLKATNPNSKFVYNLIGQAAFADAAGAKRNTTDQIAMGVDVVFGHGDGASFGMLQACSMKKAKDGGKAWFIDLIGDKRDIDKADVLLSSVLFDFSVVYDEIIQSILKDTFGRVHYVKVEDGGIYLLDPNSAVPESVIDELKSVKEKIISGSIKVVDYPRPKDFHDYLKKMM
jgi:basic membrane protein A and related proteins